MSRESEQEVIDMKKSTPLMKWGASAGALAGILGLAQLVAPPVFGWVMSGRDAKLEKLQSELAKCNGGVGRLDALAESAIDASEKRFQENEVQAIRIESSVQSLRNEVRIRHNDMPQAAYASVGSGLLYGGDRRAGQPPPSPTRQEVLEDVKNVSDAKILETATSRPEPQRQSLRKMMARGVKPDDDPLLGLDGI